MKKIKYWIEAMRLRTLPVALAGVLAAAGFNIIDGTFQWLPALLCLLFAEMCQTASNFANEYYDFRAGRDRAGREGPRRGVTEGDISPRAMKLAAYGTLAAACCVGLTLIRWGGPWLIVAGILVAAGAMAYSTGPYPLSTHGLGEVAVVVFFGLVPVNLTYYIQANAWSLPVFAASLTAGLMGANVLIVNNYRDVDDDRAAGKRTLAVRFGAARTLTLYRINALAGAALSLPGWLAIGSWCAVFPVLYVATAMAIVRSISRRKGAAITPCLGMTAVSMAAFELLFVIVAAATAAARC